MLNSAITIAFALVAVAVALNFWRLLRGPSVPDRILALDTLYVNTIALLVLLGIKLSSALYAACFSFVSQCKKKVEYVRRVYPCLDELRSKLQASWVREVAQNTESIDLSDAREETAAALAAAYYDPLLEEIVLRPGESNVRWRNLNGGADLDGVVPSRVSL